MAGGVLWIASVLMQYMFEPDGSPLRLIHQLLALAGMICSMNIVRYY